MNVLWPPDASVLNVQKFAEISRKHQENIVSPKSARWYISSAKNSSNVSRRKMKTSRNHNFWFGKCTSYKNFCIFSLTVTAKSNGENVYCASGYSSIHLWSHIIFAGRCDFCTSDLGPFLLIRLQEEEEEIVLHKKTSNLLDFFCSCHQFIDIMERKLFM